MKERKKTFSGTFSWMTVVFVKDLSPPEDISVRASWKGGVYFSKDPPPSSCYPIFWENYRFLAPFLECKFLFPNLSKKAGFFVWKKYVHFGSHLGRKIPCTGHIRNLRGSLTGELPSGGAEKGTFFDKITKFLEFSEKKNVPWFHLFFQKTYPSKKDHFFNFSGFSEG